MRRRIAACTAGVTALLLPSAAHACAVCGQFADKNRTAFLIATILLSLLPLGMIGGAIWWLRRNVLRHETFEVRDSVPAAEPGRREERERATAPDSGRFGIPQEPRPGERPA